MSSTKKILIGLAAIIIIAILWGVSTRNNLVTLDETVSSNWAQVENQLQRRYDLIPNLVSTVKGVAKHEDEIFTKIAEARSQYAGAKSPAQAIAASNAVESALSRLLVIVENYPNLKANESFNRLMDELAGSENRIAVERKRYNDSVKTFNATIRRFPTSAIANWAHLSSKDYFQINEAATETPKVEF